jgi:2-phospho-L-lactate guanylyltransferase
MAQAVIAVRGGRSAKTRCAAALSGVDRARLTAVMLDDMLTALAGCAEISRTWVVTPTPELAALANARGARVIHQPRAAGLNAALRLAIAEVSETAPYDALLLMPGDLPMLKTEDLTAALLLTHTHTVTLAPALDGGTGLIAMRAGTALAPEFGPGSFQRHAAAAARHGLSVAVIGADSLSRDVDRPDDLASVLEYAPATRTAAFLRENLKPRIRS